MYTSSFLHLVVWHVYVQYIIFFVFHIRWSSQQNTAERNRAAPTGRRWQADNLDTFSEFTSPSFASTLYILYSIYNYIYIYAYIYTWYPHFKTVPSIVLLSPQDTRLVSPQLGFGEALPHVCAKGDEKALEKILARVDDKVAPVARGMPQGCPRDGSPEFWSLIWWIMVVNIG